MRFRTLPQLSLFVLLALAARWPAASQYDNSGKMAVPLVTIDPYMSVWSMNQRLNEDHTRHWTFAEKPIIGLLKVDGRNYGFLGPWYVYDQAAEQVARTIAPTQTRYVFRAGGVELDLRFTTPVVPSNFSYASLPVTYITYEVRPADEKSHQVGVYLDFGIDWVRDDPAQDVVVTTPPAPGDRLKLFRMGTRSQPVLATAQDMHTVDWGHLYVAYPERPGVEAAAGHQKVLAYRFLNSDSIGRPVAGESLPRRYGNIDALHLTEAVAVTSHGRAAPGSPHRSIVMLAYDDVWSVEYLGRRLRAYWYKYYKTAAGMVAAAFEQADAAIRECERLDRELTADAEKVGGADYATLISLAYRQTWAGGKVVESPDGEPWFFHKENSSNGSIATVDVSYPASPYFALLNPQLLKGMIAPIFHYVESGLWPFPFAPHDIGKYPRANGQHYGLPREPDQPVDERRLMPVEECGNMLLMTALYAHVTGDRGFVERHRKPLAQWADYLEKVGVDPEEQLCTDDFMGHLAHNVNLSAKTICALGAYSRMCRLLNDEPKARHVGELATKMAAEWMRLADDGDHYRLAFDQPGTWSMKYNLVWDGILKLGLFPDEVVAKEIAYYLKIQNPYGLPLDNRDTLTKTDWLLWVASLSKDQKDFQRFVAPVMRFLRETPHPLPFPDSYKTDTASGMWGHHPGEFHLFSRVVIGGVFIQFLQDESMWMKWAKR